MARRSTLNDTVYIVMEKTIRSTKLNREGDILHKSHQIIGYADDLAVIARNEQGLKHITQKLREETWRRGLWVNEKKSKIMKIKRIKKR